MMIWSKIKLAMNNSNKLCIQLVCLHPSKDLQLATRSKIIWIGNNSQEGDVQLFCSHSSKHLKFVTFPNITLGINNSKQNSVQLLVLLQRMIDGRWYKCRSHTTRVILTRLFDYWLPFPLQNYSWWHYQRSQKQWIILTKTLSKYCGQLEAKKQ